MKVVVTASGADLDAPVDPRFGRCSFFVFVDTDTMAFEAVENQAAMAAGGAGVQAAQFVVGKGAQAVITGNVGPNAMAGLQAAGVKVYVGAEGTVRKSVELFKEGRLQEATSATASPHSGMGRGRW